MRRLVPAGIVSATVLVAALALALSAAGDERTLAFSNGANTFHLASFVGRGYVACERDVHVEGGFDALQLALFAAPRRADLTVTVAPSSGGRPIASGPVPPGSGSRRTSIATVRLSRGVPAGGSVDVCVRSRRSSRSEAKLVAIMGSPRIGGRPSHVELIGPHGGHAELGTDFHLVFLRDHPRSVLSQVPAIFRRAALFRPGFVGAWTYWALLAIVLVAVPALLVRALRAAEVDSR